ncbi:MAG TPA: COR domain-containing protein [Xanthobacteraceae bacterium]|jgi:internalin A|nr:COR domain-containing protein [Xanthobacteraceae bacterium]
MNTEGFAIALERIAHEAKEKTGFLDLGRLGLDALPDEIFGLKHLRRFNLGDWYNGENGQTLASASSFESNSIVTETGRLAALPALQSLWLVGTDFSDAGKLSAITELRELGCSSTQVSDLAPLKGLPNLQSLSCSYTQVSDLAPLKGLPNLQSLSCSSTQVSDLAPLKGLPNLQSLDCSRCRLAAVNESFWAKPSLRGVFFYQTHLVEIPVEVLSRSERDNCLEAIRAHLRDLKAGRTLMQDVKLMVLGNGRVGKTQICRRLRGENYNETVESTHGIIVTSAPLPTVKSDETARLQIWDFGGQDIYHGTHALFMRSRAIFAAVWIPETETALEHQYGGFVFRNQPLGYWLEYIRHFGSAGSPTLIVQTRCDKAEDERPRVPASNEIIDALTPPPKILRYSAKEDRGRASLDEAILHAIASLRERQGIAVIGAGRADVKREIEAMRDADAARPPRERVHRTIAYDDFVNLCDLAGGISDVRQFLIYLHNAGTIFYREGLFENRVIVDQGWALEAIYAVLHREKCFLKLKRQNGGFTRTDLAEWIWNEQGYGVKEQELFISMMQSCGICFRYRAGSGDGRIEAEYIAPDFLPEKPASEIAQKWDRDRPTESAQFDYSLLTPALMRGVLARVGEVAGVSADYWRDGVYVYESTTGSRGLIEQTMTGPWQGAINIQTQRGQATVLLERLTELIGREENRVGMTSTGRKPAADRWALEEETADDDKKPESKPPLRFAQEPGPKPEWFISYAWKDDTPEGLDRESDVDNFCEAAKKRGITINRDKDVLKPGDRISRFMRRMTQGDRVFVVLSAKYLQSTYCMHELYGLYRECSQEDDKFLKRTRVVVRSDAKIWTVLDRAKCALYWKERYGELEAYGSKHGYDLLGKGDYEDYLLMKDFARHIGDILRTVVDELRPSQFDGSDTYFFD